MSPGYKSFFLRILRVGGDLYRESDDVTRPKAGGFVLVNMCCDDNRENAMRNRRPERVMERPYFLFWGYLLQAGDAMEFWKIPVGTMQSGRGVHCAVDTYSASC
jgi:hypothetical protein